MSPEDAHTLSLATAVREAHARCLSPEGGFLPPAIPAQVLPTPFEIWANICRASIFLPCCCHNRLMLVTALSSKALVSC